MHTVTENQYFGQSTFMSTFSKLMISSFKFHFFVGYSLHLKSNKVTKVLECTLYMLWTVQVRTRACFGSLHCKKEFIGYLKCIICHFTLYYTASKDKLCICNVILLLFTMTK